MAFAALLLLLASHPAVALIEYAPEMRPMDEIRGTSSPGAREGQVEMRNINALTADVAQVPEAAPAESAEPAGTNGDLSVSHESQRIDSASWGTGSAASAPLDSSPLVKALFSSKFPLSLEFVTAPGSVAQEELIVRLHEGDLFIKHVSLTRDLEARTAQGALSKEEADAIIGELARLQGAVFKLPRSEQDLKGALGFAIETAIVPNDLPDLITVHVQLGLGLSMQASSYLVEVLGGLISNRN